MNDSKIKKQTELLIDLSLKRNRGELMSDRQTLFKLHSDYEPAGDQPKAIAELAEGLKLGLKHQILLGVTGSGKTYTMANVIAKVQKPTLVIAHNKILAAQLYGEFKSFFRRMR